MPRHTESIDHILIHRAGSCLGHCPHRVLGIARRADLACDKDIKWEMKGEAELVTHNHAATRKSQNEATRVVTILQQLSGKQTACLFTVLEDHGYSFFMHHTRPLRRPQ